MWIQLSLSSVTVGRPSGSITFTSLSNAKLMRAAMNNICQINFGEIWLERIENDISFDLVFDWTDFYQFSDPLGLIQFFLFLACFCSRVVKIIYVKLMITYSAEVWWVNYIFLKNSFNPTATLHTLALTINLFWSQESFGPSIKFEISHLDLTGKFLTKKS